MISVVMPAYNASKFIAPAIESILNQTFKDFELLIIDDGSTDNTLEIIQGYVEKDHRVKLIQSEHGGLSCACNLGISQAKYSWIARMDADDIALPERFEKQINAANANPNVVAWGTYVYHINSQGNIISLNQVGPQTEEQFYHIRNQGHIAYLPHPTVLLNKDILLKAGGYSLEFGPAQDLDLFDRMATFGPLLVIPEPLLLYRVHLQSASMEKFFVQKLATRYVVARHRARLAGEKESSYEEFIQEYKQHPLFYRLKRHLRMLGMFYYRKAGLCFGEKQYLPASFYLSISALLHPKYSMPRLWNQVLSPKTRKLLNSTSTEV